MRINAELNLGSINLRLEDAEMVDTATGEHFAYDGTSEGVKRPQRMVDAARALLGQSHIIFEDPWLRKFSMDLPDGTALERARELAGLRSQNGQAIWRVFCGQKEVQPNE